MFYSGARCNRACIPIEEIRYVLGGVFLIYAHRKKVGLCQKKCAMWAKLCIMFLFYTHSFQPSNNDMKSS